MIILSTARARCWRVTTTVWKRSRSAFWSTLQCMRSTRSAHRHDPVPGGPSRRGQDLHRAVGGPGAGTEVHPGVAGRRARRGGDPRPPHAPTSARCPDESSTSISQCGHHEPRVPAGRDRQDGQRHARRSRLGHAGGAGSRAEPAASAITIWTAPFDLSRRAVHHHGQHHRRPSPAPLLDRMEIIEVPSYTPEEKVQIARRHLLPKAAGGTRPDEGAACSCPKTARCAPSSAATHPGVRRAHAGARRSAQMCRKVTLEFAENATSAKSFRAATRQLT